MKVVFVDLALDRMGGVERVVSTLANALVDIYEVKICSVYKYSKTPFYHYNGSIKFKYLIDNSTLLSTHSKTKGGFYFFRSIEKFFEIFYFTKRIKKCCVTELKDADIIIFCRTLVAITFLPFLNEFQGKVIVRDANHLHYVNKKNREKLINYFPDMVNTLVISSEESGKLYKNLFKERLVNIRKIYNPLGITPVIKDWEDSNKRIVGVGRYDRQKGFENLLLAFAQVYSLHNDWKLALIGKGSDIAHYKRICRKWGISQAVEFRESMNIAEEYAKSDIFVMSSRGEGYANALVEAMACGVAVISYDWYVGVEDIINNGENGIIVPLKNREKYFRTNYIDHADVENLAKAINSLIEDEGLRIRLGESAAKIASSREKEYIVNEWIKIIEGID